MYGFGGTSIQPRYAAIGGRGMGEYFQSGVSGLGEYFQSGVSGLGEYFQSGVSGLGALPSYEANAGYGANPDLMEAAAGIATPSPQPYNGQDRRSATPGTWHMPVGGGRTYPMQAHVLGIIALLVVNLILGVMRGNSQATASLPR